MISRDPVSEGPLYTTLHYMNILYMNTPQQYLTCIYTYIYTYILIYILSQADKLDLGGVGS